LARFLLYFGACCTNKAFAHQINSKISRDQYGSTKTGRGFALYFVGRHHGAGHARGICLELGTVRKKNQVNALVKILVDFSVSTVVYFVVGYSVAYGTNFFVGAEQLAAKNGYDLVKFFFLLTFAAAIPAIVSGGIAERAKFWPQLIATACIVGFVYPFFEGIVWNQHFGVQAWIKATTGESFTILRVPWWFMPWGVGSHCLQ